jgi:hypothetical protein
MIFHVCWQQKSLRTIQQRPVMQNIEEMLSLEIKKEIADRYFGFRKMIEDDGRQYEQHIRETYRLLEDKVGFDLIRLYILLRQEPLIHDFFRFTGLRDELFFDVYLLQAQPLRRRLFRGQRCYGLTRRARFQHLFFDTYSRIVEGMETYRAALKRVTEEGQHIAQEIEVFYRQNDLGTMMGFLRGLDSGSHGEGLLNGGIAPLRDNHFEQKMRIEVPVAAEKRLPSFPALPPLKTCKSRMRDLADAAYEAQGKPEIRTYVA